jgi:hypothetical protein
LRCVPGAPAVGHDAETDWFVCEHKKGIHKKGRIFEIRGFEVRRFEVNKDCEEIHEGNGKDGGGLASAPDDAHARAV